MLCATNSHLFKVAHHIIDSPFSARVTTPLSFSAIRLIALRTRRAGCIPARVAGALVLKLKYCCAWFIAGSLFPFVTSMVPSTLPCELTQIAIAKTDSIYDRQRYDFHPWSSIMKDHFSLWHSFVFPCLLALELNPNWHRDLPIERWKCELRLAANKNPLSCGKLN